MSNIISNYTSFSVTNQLISIYDILATVKLDLPEEQTQTHNVSPYWKASHDVLSSSEWIILDIYDFISQIKSLKW